MADKQSSLTPLTNAVTVLTESATEDGITFQPCEDTTCDCSSIALGKGILVIKTFTQYLCTFYLLLFKSTFTFGSHRKTSKC